MGTDKDDYFSIFGQFNIVICGYGHDLIDTYGDNVVYGDAGDDKFYVINDHNTIYGGSGDDEILVYDSQNYVVGGSGDDYIEVARWILTNTLRGGSGNDTIIASVGDDLLVGGAGDDVIRGVSGNDKLRGGRGSDQFEFFNDGGVDVVKDFGFDDSIELFLYSDESVTLTGVRRHVLIELDDTTVKIRLATVDEVADRLTVHDAYDW